MGLTDDDGTSGLILAVPSFSGMSPSDAARAVFTNLSSVCLPFCENWSGKFDVTVSVDGCPSWYTVISEGTDDVPDPPAAHPTSAEAPAAADSWLDTRSCFFSFFSLLSPTWFRLRERQDSLLLRTKSGWKNAPASWPSATLENPYIYSCGQWQRNGWVSDYSCTTTTSNNVMRVDYADWTKHIPDE